MRVEHCIQSSAEGKGSADSFLVESRLWVLGPAMILAVPCLSVTICKMVTTQGLPPGL